MTQDDVVCIIEKHHTWFGFGKTVWHVLDKDNNWLATFRNEDNVVDFVQSEFGFTPSL